MAIYAMSAIEFDNFTSLFRLYPFTPSGTYIHACIVTHQSVRI